MSFYLNLFYFAVIFLMTACAPHQTCQSPVTAELIPKTENRSKVLLPKEEVVAIKQISDVGPPIAVPVTSVFWQVPTKSSVIVIDPGHGGEDFGTHSTTKPKYQEKYLNLATAIMLRNYLQQMGYKTLMTRKEDTFISLDKRASFANRLKPTLFVSVHYNSAPSPKAEGIEVYYYNSEEQKERAQQSKLLAQAVLTQVIKNTNAKSRGVKHGNFAVIRETEMPAVLIEGGFLTNEDEMQKIKDPAYLKRIAWGIAKGVDEYLSKGTVLAGIPKQTH